MSSISAEVSLTVHQVVNNHQCVVLGGTPIYTRESCSHDKPQNRKAPWLLPEPGEQEGVLERGQQGLHPVQGGTFLLLSIFRSARPHERPQGTVTCAEGACRRGERAPPRSVSLAAPRPAGMAHTSSKTWQWCYQKCAVVPRRIC